MLRIYACVNAQIIERPYDPSVEAEQAADEAEEKHDAPIAVEDAPAAKAEVAQEAKAENEDI